MDNQMISDGLARALQSAIPVQQSQPNIANNLTGYVGPKKYPKWVKNLLISVFIGLAYHKYLEWQKEKEKSKKQHLF